MKQTELDVIINLHNKWLNNETGGERADLWCADLRRANLRGADLRCADLRGADLEGANLNWVNWHESTGLKVYVAGLQSSRDNAQLTYIPSLDVATTGCYQGTWTELKQRVADEYKDQDERIYKAYQLAIDYIEAQVALDKAFGED